MEYLLIAALTVIILIVVYFVYKRREPFYGARTVTFYYRNGCAWCDEMEPIWNDLTKLQGFNITFRKVRTDNMINPPPIVPAFSVADSNGVRVRSGAVNGDTLLKWILLDKHNNLV